jgi:hypothetical protein
VCVRCCVAGAQDLHDPLVGFEVEGLAFEQGPPTSGEAFFSATEGVAQIFDGGLEGRPDELGWTIRVSPNRSARKHDVAIRTGTLLANINLGRPTTYWPGSTRRVAATYSVAGSSPMERSPRQPLMSSRSACRQ